MERDKHEGKATENRRKIGKKEIVEEWGKSGEKIQVGMR